MDSRLKAVLADTSKLDRIRNREAQKIAREKQFVMLKNSTLPEIEPNVRIFMNFKCGMCNAGSLNYTKRHDWYVHFVDIAAKLNVKEESWMDWIKEFFISEPVVAPPLDPIVIHPAYIKMIKNVQQSEPGIPIVFVLKPVLPSDLNLIENVLATHDVKLQLTMPRDGKKISESKVAAVLQSGGNILLTLEDFDYDDLKSVLKASDFGFAVKILLLPITMNSELFIEGNRGITKIVFLEPYTVKDLLQSKQAPTDQERAFTNIADHLRYDLAWHCPAMSTGAFAFLMMTDFRIPMTSFEYTYNMLEDMRDANPLVDFGFEGHTEDIAHRGIQLLSEFIEVDDDLISLINDCDKLRRLWRYAKVLMPHHIYQPILVRCARKLRKEEKTIDYPSLIKHSLELCDILKFAVPFTKPCNTPEPRLQEALDNLAALEYLQKPLVQTFTESEQRAMRIARNFDLDNDSDDDDGYQSRNTENEVKILKETVKKFEVLILPILDAYVSMAYAFKAFMNVEDFTVESFINKSIKIMCEEVEDEHCEFWESTDRYLMESCLKLFVSWEIVEVKGDMMNIHPDHNNKRAIKKLIKNIEKFLEEP